MTFLDVAPVGGDVIGKAADALGAWLLCERYGLRPLAMVEVSKPELVPDDSGANVWRVACEHAKFPYDRAAWENRTRDALASLDDGQPAWALAELNGIAFNTFKARLRRGWSGQRAATEGTVDFAPDLSDEWEAEAVANGLSVRAYRARVRAGCPPSIAATMGLRSWKT